MILSYKAKISVIYKIGAVGRKFNSFQNIRLDMFKIQRKNIEVKDMNKPISNIKRQLRILTAKTAIKTMGIWNGFAMAAAGVTTGVTGYSSDLESASGLKDMITNALNLVFAVVAFGGVINIISGAIAISKGLQDDGGGQDAAAVSKGKGRLIGGAIAVAPVALIAVITKGKPADIVTRYITG